jgi:hypothetical protein
MAETLGSICDKLTIVKLKQFHTEDQSRLESLNQQEGQLKSEIDNLFLTLYKAIYRLTDFHLRQIKYTKNQVTPSVISKEVLVKFLLSLRK